MLARLRAGSRQARGCDVTACGQFLGQSFEGVLNQMSRPLGFNFDRYFFACRARIPERGMVDFFHCS